MLDPDVANGWRVLRAIPQDDSYRSYVARMAVHTLVWDLWRLRDELRELKGETK